MYNVSVAFSWQEDKKEEIIIINDGRITNFILSEIKKVPYKPDAAVDDVLCFKYYNEDEVILDKKMKDWLRFSACYWHTFRGTGAEN